MYRRLILALALGASVSSAGTAQATLLERVGLKKAAPLTKDQKKAAKVAKLELAKELMVRGPQIHIASTSSKQFIKYTAQDGKEHLGRVLDVWNSHGAVGVRVRHLSSGHEVRLNDAEIASAKPSEDAHSVYHNSLSVSQREIRAMFNHEDYRPTNGPMLASHNNSLDKVRKLQGVGYAVMATIQKVKAPLAGEGLNRDHWTEASYRTSMTGDRIKSMKANQRHIWVITADGEFRMAPEHGFTKHLKLANGGVLAAGEAMMRDGKLVMDLKSGTFMNVVRNGPDRKTKVPWMASTVTQAVEKLTGVRPEVVKKGPWYDEAEAK